MSRRKKDSRKPRWDEDPYNPVEGTRHNLTDPRHFLGEVLEVEGYYIGIPCGAAAPGIFKTLDEAKAYVDREWRYPRTN